METILFAYGTLQHSRIISYVLDRIPDSAPAKIIDFARYAICNADYPGLIKEIGAITTGTAFFDIRKEEWKRLDTYESDLYHRRTERIELEDGTKTKADVYVLPSEHHHILSKNLWDLNQYHPNPQP